MFSSHTDSKAAFASRHSHSHAKPEARVQSRDLLRDAREVLIQHGAQLYRLRHTRAGKLILTK